MNLLESLKQNTTVEGNTSDIELSVWIYELATVA